MTLAFELSMPGVGSWNGKWSGEGRCYAIIKTFRGKKEAERAAKLASQGSFGWSFSDGWYASVSVRSVTATEARSLRKRSVGFAGYDWMVKSILMYGQIFDDHAERKHLEERKAVVAT
jgi:hypothetical protein